MHKFNVQSQITYLIGAYVAVMGLFAVVALANHIVMAGDRPATTPIVIIMLLFASVLVMSGLVRRRLNAQEFALVSSQDRFRDFAHSTADVFWEMDANGIVTMLETASQSGFLVARDDIIGRTAAEIVGKNELRDPDTVAKFAALIAKQAPFRDFTYAVRAPDGGWFWRTISGVPFFDRQGRYAGARGSILDQTARFRAEERGALTIAKYKAAAAASHETFFSIDPEGLIDAVDGFDEKSSRTLAEKFIGKGVDELLPWNAEPNALAIVATNMAKASSFRDVDIKARNFKTNELSWYRICGAPLFDHDGQRGGYLLTATNIDDARAAERENLTIKERYDQLLASIPGVAFRWIGARGRGRVDYISPSVRQLTGFSPEEVVVRSTPALVLKEDHDSTVAQVRADLAAGRTYERRVRVGKKDGTFAWVIEKGVKIGTTADGKYVVDVIMLDITQTALAEARAREAEQILSSVISNLSAGVYSFTVERPGIYKVNYASPRVSSFLGYQPGQDGEPWNLLDVLDDENRRKIVKLDGEAAISPGSFEDVRQFRNAKGEVRWVSSRGRFVRDGEGALRKEGIVIDVTEQRERDARAQEMAAALEEIEDGVAINDNDGRIIFCNAAMANLVDAPDPERLIGARPFDLVRPTGEVTVEILRADLAQARAQGRPWRYGFEVTTNAGHRKHLEGTVTMLGTSRMISIIRDATERVEAEKSKQAIAVAIARLARDDQVASGDLTRAFRRITEETGCALRVARAGIWLLEDDGRTLTCADLYTNADSRHATGLQIPVVGRETYFAVLNTERVIVANDARSHPATTCFTSGYLEPLGITSVLNVPLRLAGRIAGVFCCEHVGPARTWTADEVTFAMVACDITAHAIDAAERKLAQHNLAEMTQRLSGIVAALDNANDSIMILDAGVRVIYLNPSAVALLDCESAGAAIGVSARDLIQVNDSRRDADEAYGVYRTALERVGHISFSRGFCIMRSNAVKHVAGTTTRLLGGGRIVVMHDAAERLAQEKKESELREQLVQAKKMEAIGSLAGGIAHDFNNLVAVMRSFAELIDHDAATNGKAKIYAGRIVKTCDRATDLVKQIMTFSRAGSAEREPIKLGNVLDEVALTVISEVPAHLELNMPRFESDFVVMGNSGQLIQVVMNLCLNALDAMRTLPHGMIDVNVARASAGELTRLTPGLAAMAENFDGTGAVWRFVQGAPESGVEYVRLKVSDTGMGIAPKMMERIFEPFFTTKEKGRGTGLGLAIASSVVAAHRGLIAVSSAVGVGTTFDVYLPMAQARPTLASRAPESQAAVRGHERVMIIDDEVDLADALSMGLTALGYETLPVYDAEEALELFDENPDLWDVVVTDQVMPKMQGLVLIRELRRRRPDLKVVLYTGHSETATADSAYAAGAAAFALKPISVLDLARELRRILSGPSQHQNERKKVQAIS
ncbi:MAG: PAS domain S-box protein [Rhodospirillaceae bacterium]|nr:PAS domain S-box protein [Rhodospirillaceae bacterium]